MNKLVILLVMILLSGCTAKKISGEFDKNIENFNQFYHENSSDPLQSVVPPQEEYADTRTCNRADIKANNVTLSELAKLLSALYSTNISYAYNIDDTDPAINLASTDTNISNKSKNANPPSSDLTDKLSLNMSDVCIEDVFSSLTEIYEIGVKRFSYGYLVYPRQLRTETFAVDYHNFYRKGKSSTSIASSQLQANGSDNGTKSNYSAISTESEETFWTSITNTVRSILNSDKERKLASAANNGSPQNTEDFYVYKESGLIVVTAYPKQLKYIRDFLSKVNRNSTRQVLIEAKILEVELNDEFSNGIQWDTLKRKLYYTSLSPITGTISNINDLHNTQNLSSADDLLSSSISGKIIGGNNFNAIMQALSSQGKISVISSPRILVLNNQRALIKSGEDQYFVTNVSNVTFDSSSKNHLESKSGFDLEPFFSGIALDTTPNIINNQELLLHIHPMISRVEDQKKSITIDNKDTKIPVAMIQSREADTVVRAKNGDIIILGGMTQSFVRLDKTGMPIKSQGFLAKILDTISAKKYQSKKAELIILIKPTIIDSFNNREDIGTFTLKEE